jgi:hypothetical protein
MFIKCTIRSRGVPAAALVLLCFAALPGVISAGKAGRRRLHTQQPEPSAHEQIPPHRLLCGTLFKPWFKAYADNRLPIRFF